MIPGTVVVGVDGSIEGEHAAALGVRLAEAAGGRVRFVTAAPDLAVEVAAIRARLPMPRVREALIAAASERALGVLERVTGRGEAERALTVRLGRSAHVLAEMGREVGVDLFVLGGHRHPATKRLGRGTAHHLLRVADRPVVLTGPDGGAFERVVAAVDISFAAAPTLAVASRLAHLLDLPLEALHVASRPELPRSLRLRLDFDPSPQEVEEQARRELSQLLPPNTPLTVRGGEVEASLCEVVERGPTALLVLGAQGRGWKHRLLLGSTTESLLATLPCALAIVPLSRETAR